MSALKQIRGQIRQIVKEILPQVLSDELVSTINKQLQQELKARLDQIDQRQKDIQSYVVRNSSGVNLPKKD